MYAHLLGCRFIYMQMRQIRRVNTSEVWRNHDVKTCGTTSIEQLCNRQTAWSFMDLKKKIIRNPMQNMFNSSDQEGTRNKTNWMCGREARVWMDLAHFSWDPSAFYLELMQRWKRWQNHEPVLHQQTSCSWDGPSTLSKRMLPMCFPPCLFSCQDFMMPSDLLSDFFLLLFFGVINSDQVTDKWVHRM